MAALAAHEKLPPPPRAAQRRLIRDLGRKLHARVAERDGRVVGFALYYFTYASFRGRPVFHLEDVYVTPEARGRGAGRAFFRAFRALARRAGCVRLEWIVLRSNRSALRFYEALGARPLVGWLTYRLPLGP